jgi:hypothetical protein
MAPLWKQREKDRCSAVEKRAVSDAECRRSTMARMHTYDHIHFDKLTAPWTKSAGDLKEGDEAEDVPGSTTRLVAELQRLECPAVSEPAEKVRRFHHQIVQLSTNARAER